jgi:hypothetical protein
MRIEIIGELTEGAVATARIETAAGTMLVMAEVAMEGRCLVLQGLHMRGIDVGINELRVTGLRFAVREFMEALDVDEMVIEGSRRTTGAGPGRTPRRLRFARNVSAAK